MKTALTATKSPTLATLNKLAKKRFGPLGFVRHHKDAISPEEREKRRAKIADYRKSIKTLEADLTTLTTVTADLARSARFVCDVNGDYPSIDELRDAVKRFDYAQGLRDDIANHKAEIDRLRIDLHHYKYAAGYTHDSSIGAITGIHIQTDTAEQMADKLNNR